MEGCTNHRKLSGNCIPFNGEEGYKKKAKHQVRLTQEFFFYYYFLFSFLLVLTIPEAGVPLYGVLETGGANPSPDCAARLWPSPISHCWSVIIVR